MAATWDDPYGLFKFLITISPESGGEFRGGFSQFSSLHMEIRYADYREGTEPINRPRKNPLMNTGAEVALKRGLIAALDLWPWVSRARRGNMQARATLVAKDSSEVAMEMLVLACEEIAFDNVALVN
jgi:phage tail-like protein